MDIYVIIEIGCQSFSLLGPVVWSVRCLTVSQLQLVGLGCYGMYGLFLLHEANLTTLSEGTVLYLLY